LVQAGYKTYRQGYEVRGKECYNISTESTPNQSDQPILIVCAHYDSVLDSPGANDNGSGVAAALALARRFIGREVPMALRFAFFANEEPPFFQTEQMGSFVYAKQCRQNQENIVVVLCLETIGYYSNENKSQRYPPPFSLFYPSTGNFIGFVSNLSSRKLLYRAIESFRTHCKFPSEGGAIPEIVPGINWSDHWSFWRQGYSAIMITDTAEFRYPYYHSDEDTPDRINYENLARVVSGLESVIEDLATGFKK
jgi:Zn-dependent M28 family amino/carboxypeptidase